MTGRTAVVGMARHAASEYPGTSVHYLFTSLEEAVTGNYSVTKLSPWFHIFPPNERRRAARDFLSSCDLAIVTGGLMELFTARAQLANPPCFLYLALGELPRGATSLRAALNLFLPGDVIIVSSNADSAILRRLIHSIPAGVELLPFGIDTDLFAPMDQERRSILRSYMGFRPNDVVFLYAGRVTPEKNVHTSLAVLSELAEHDANVKFVVSGDFSPQPIGLFAEKRHNFDQLFSDVIFQPPASFRGRYEYIGMRDRHALPDLYGCADVFLNLTLNHDENFGYAQVEAMSCGLPVICSDWGGLKDTVDDGVTGFRVPTMLTGWGVYVDRGAALLECKALAASDDLRRTMASQARKRALDIYSLRQFRHSVSQTLASMLLGGRDVRPHIGTAKFTGFGADYTLAFSRIVPAGGGDEVLIGRIEYPFYTEKSYTLYANLIEPYASGRQRGDCEDGGELYIAPLVYKIEFNLLEIDDILWPRQVLLDPEELAVVRMLAERRRSTKDELLQLAEDSNGIDATRIEAAVRRLLMKGVVLCSRARVGTFALN